jgi:uncharacterized protein YndB with AHSA1/START domain
MRPLDDFSTPTPTSARIVRTFDAPAVLVWRAHTEPELVKQWMTGPEGHTLPVCEIDFRVGGRGRYVWSSPDMDMGMTAEFKEIVEHERIVYTETYDGWPEGSTTVTATFSESAGKTTLTVDIEYLTPQARDLAMEPGFAEGFAASFTRLDDILPSLDGAVS